MSKILIIDDELEICKQVSLILKKNEFNTSYVTSYEEFVNLHKNNLGDIRFKKNVVHFV